MSSIYPWKMAMILQVEILSFERPLLALCTSVTEDAKTSHGLVIVARLQRQYPSCRPGMTLYNFKWRIQLHT